MKIAIRGGHNFQSTGAVGLINETIEDRKVKDSTIKYLRESGHKVLDVTPGNCDVNTDLAYGVNKAEEWGADLFISIHFDKCYDSYNGSLGTGTWIYGTGGNAETIANRIVDKVSEGTGFKNRGVKINPRLYELRKTSMSAIIVEVCFCEASEDVRIYKEKGADAIGCLIAKGISNTENINIDHNSNNSKDSFISKTNARAIVALDPRNNPSNNYTDLGEIFANERIKIIDEVCDKGCYLPITYWKDGQGRESDKVWISVNKRYLELDTNATVVNVRTQLLARYNPSLDSETMGYVKNGEKLHVHRTEGNYVLATYYAGSGYKTAWFTAKYLAKSPRL